jgi:hypothetical protein
MLVAYSSSDEEEAAPTNDEILTFDVDSREERAIKGELGATVEIRKSVLSLLFPSTV